MCMESTLLFPVPAWPSVWKLSAGARREQQSAVRQGPWRRQDVVAPVSSSKIQQDTTEHHVGSLWWLLSSSPRLYAGAPSPPSSPAPSPAGALSLPRRLQSPSRHRYSSHQLQHCPCHQPRHRHHPHHRHSRGGQLLHSSQVQISCDVFCYQPGFICRNHRRKSVENQQNADDKYKQVNSTTFGRDLTIQELNLANYNYYISDRDSVADHIYEVIDDSYEVIRPPEVPGNCSCSGDFSPTGNGNVYIRKPQHFNNTNHPIVAITFDKLSSVKDWQESDRSNSQHRQFNSLKTFKTERKFTWYFLCCSSNCDKPKCDTPFINIIKNWIIWPSY